MKKIIIILIFLFINIPLFAQTETTRLFNIKFKGEEKVETLPVIDANTNYITIIRYGQKTKISMEMVESLQAKDAWDNDASFKRVIMTTDMEYYEGYIIYQDRNKITVQIGDGIKSIQVKQIRDIINANDFFIEKNKSAYGALWRSALYPGVGQLYTSNRMIYGVTYMAFFSLSMVSGVYFYTSGQNYYDQYKKSKYKDTASYKKYYTFTGIAYVSFFSAICIYVWNVFDAYIFFTYKYDVLNKEEEKEIKSNEKISLLNNNKIEVIFQKRF